MAPRSSASSLGVVCGHAHTGRALSLPVSLFSLSPPFPLLVDPVVLSILRPTRHLILDSSISPSSPAVAFFLTANVSLVELHPFSPLGLCICVLVSLAQERARGRIFLRPWARRQVHWGKTVSPHPVQAPHGLLIHSPPCSQSSLAKIQLPRESPAPRSLSRV